MTTFTDDDQSIEASQPREGFEIVIGATTYRLASGSRDVTINGNVYTASSICRAEQAVSSAGGSKSMEITIVASHPLVTRYMANGVPPRQITVTIWQLQLRSGQVQHVWTGNIASIAFEKHNAKFLVPSRSGQAFNRSLPIIASSIICPHVLYDANCRAPRASFLVVTTVASHDGSVVTVASMGAKPSQWAKYGEMLHVASGERMSISDQTGNVITMQLPIYEMSAGDQVYVYAGCDRGIATCNSKFANKDNFGGQPATPGGNPFIPTGNGVAGS